MTFFTRCDAPQEFHRSATSRGRPAARHQRGLRLRALADFMEEIDILFRYAIGRDYYDRDLLRQGD